MGTCRLLFPYSSINKYLNEKIQEHQVLIPQFPYHPLLFPWSSSFRSAGFASRSCPKTRGTPERGKEGAAYVF